MIQKSFWHLLFFNLLQVLTETVQLIKDYIMPFVSIVHELISGFSVHKVVFWICIIVGVSILFALIYTLVRYHRLEEKLLKASHSCLLLELIWAIVPIVILVLLVMPAVHMMPL